MHFVPFANGCTPPVLDKDAIWYMQSVIPQRVWFHFMVIYLQARKTPLNTLLISFLSKIRKGTWMSKKLIFWNEMNLSGWIWPLGTDVELIHNRLLCIKRSCDPVNHKKSLWYKIVARNGQSLMELIRLPIMKPIFEACLKWTNRMIFTISGMLCL